MAMSRFLHSHITFLSDLSLSELSALCSYPVYHGCNQSNRTVQSVSFSMVVAICDELVASQCT